MTMLENLDLYCDHHHDLKTYSGGSWSPALVAGRWWHPTTHATPTTPAERRRLLPRPRRSTGSTRPSASRRSTGSQPSPPRSPDSRSGWHASAKDAQHRRGGRSGLPLRHRLKVRRPHRTGLSPPDRGRGRGSRNRAGPNRAHEARREQPTDVSRSWGADEGALHPLPAHRRSRGSARR